MRPANLEVFHKAIRASRFQELLATYHFELTYARYDFSPRDHDISEIIFQSKPYQCSLLFIYPGGTVDVYIGPISLDFLSADRLRIDYVAAYFLRQPLVIFHESKFLKVEDIMNDILLRLYEIFAPFANQSIELFRNSNATLIEDIKEYIQRNLRQKWSTQPPAGAAG
jgi:hypothetical protein